MKTHKSTTIESDEEYLQKFAEGDRSMIDAIYRRHYKSLYLYGQRLGADEYLIEEAIHDLFLNFFKYKTSLGHIENVKFYLFRSFRNLLIKKTSHKSNFILLNDVEIEAPSDQVDEEEKIKKVKELINSLSPREKEIILLKFYENQSNNDIAEILGIDYLTVRNLISRAYKKIRNLGKGTFLLFMGVLLQEMMNTNYK